MRKFLLVILCQTVFSLPSFADSDGTTQPQAHPADMLVSTTSELEGYRIKEYKGVVRGVTVRQPTIGQSLSANLERLKGGHISAYAAMCDRARDQAYEECLAHARELGANAIIAIRYDSSAFEHGDNIATEVVCYGTAVTVERETKVVDRTSYEQPLANRLSPH